MNPGFIRSQRLSHDLSHQPKYNIFEPKIRGVIITRGYRYDLYLNTYFPPTSLPNLTHGLVAN